MQLKRELEKMYTFKFWCPYLGYRAQLRPKGLLSSRSYVYDENFREKRQCIFDKVYLTSLKNVKISASTGLQDK